MKLTEKQKRFADYYIQTANATESAIRAGYSKNTASETGYENLKKPHIKKHIEEKLKELDNQRVADAKEVLEYLTSILRGEEKEETVVVEGKGEGMSRARNVEKAISAKDRLKAAELLAKRYGLLTDVIKGDINTKIEIVDDIE